MNNNLPLGCKDDLDAPFNEVDYEVPITATVSTIIWFSGKPGLSEEQQRDMVDDIFERFCKNEELILEELKCV